MNSSTEAGDLITRTLTASADDAPHGDTLLADVHHRLRRRRRVRAAGTGVLACTAVAATITGVGVVRDGPVPAAAPSASLPAADPVLESAAKGWHWESYDTVQVQVPDSWVDSGYTHLWSCGPAFASREARARTPLVGRPFPAIVPAIGCPAVPSPDRRAPHLWFGDRDRKPGVTRYDHGWIEEVRIVGGVTLSVFGTDHALLERILDSARPTGGTDVFGCPTSPPAVLAKGRRPAGPGLTEVGEVSSVQLCGYTPSTSYGPGELLAGGVLAGNEARQLAEALRGAPAGSGPDNEYLCKMAALRDELVITVRGSTGEQPVVVRYQGCANGIDDGRTMRQVTGAALLPVLRKLYTQQASPMILEGQPR
ncbi:hypothetical protein [Kribbella sp. DT2]|uniref:hypothetical protein n=1 Tax=Kribbella sp. DT2 TaxID=3393427 RepID=UPI003CF1EA37